MKATTLYKYEYIKSIDRGIGKTCLCSRPAFKFKQGAWVCKRCDDLETIGYEHAQFDSRKSTLHYWDFGILHMRHLRQ